MFFVGLILIVFAGLFHVYRYGMNKANEPPPPPTPIPEQKPKALADQASSVKELPDATAEKKLKESPKEAPKTT